MFVVDKQVWRCIVVEETGECTMSVAQHYKIGKKSKKNLPDIGKLDIDVIIPLSGSMYIPHLKNCLASISKQVYQSGDIGITVSCLMYEESLDIEKLGKLCMAHEATLVFTKPIQESFSRGYALNIGARQGSRAMLAFIDADVYLHENTLSMAVSYCAKKAVMAIIPVARTEYEPNHPIWTMGVLNKEEYWRNLVNELPYARGGFGNAVVRRDIFESIHGHDERFYGWGGIDTDIYYRMRKSGRVVDMEDVKILRALHQKHGTPPSKRNPKNTKRNRMLLKESKTIVRNPVRWGRVRCQ